MSTKKGPYANGSDADPTSPTRPRGRKRTSLQSLGRDVSIESGDNDDDGNGGSRIGVKRACNECRQQKLRCDVVQEPFQPCSRCKRVHLECKIDSNFRRVGKRVKNAEMERELAELRRRVAGQSSSPTAQGPLHSPYMNDGSGHIGTTSVETPTMHTSPATTTGIGVASPMDQYMGSEEAVASLLGLRSGNGTIKPARQLENVVLLDERVKELWAHFIAYSHPYFSLLDPDRSPDHYFEASPLLFWVVLATAARHYTPEPQFLNMLAGPLTRLLWQTLASVPQSYHVVKALCFLCTWPLPIASSSTDPTFMLSGLMMQIALQIGLHRPSHAQDFSKFRVDLRAEELKDRVTTWAACNIVAQRVATGYGQPPSSLYDWTLIHRGTKEESFRLQAETEARVSIERFCNKVTEALYRNPSDPVGLVDDLHKSYLTVFLGKEYDEMLETLRPVVSPTTNIYLHAASLHLRLSAFFDSPTTKDYHADLLALWASTTSFLDAALNLSIPNTPPAGPKILSYAPNYILQMLVAAGFVLLKLLNSFFATSVDLEFGRALFSQTISAIRGISVASDDLAWRLAEVLTQLWRRGGAGAKSGVNGASATIDNSLQLKVRCRMSMSVVHDSVWRWREEFQLKGKGLYPLKNRPTNPDSSTHSTAPTSASLSPADHQPPQPTSGGGTSGTSGNTHSNQHLSSSHPNHLSLPHSAINPNNISLPLSDANNYQQQQQPSHSAFMQDSSTMLFPESTYEVFDPLNWMLDGLVDFPFGGGPFEGEVGSGGENLQ